MTNLNLRQIPTMGYYLSKEGGYFRAGEFGLFDRDPTYFRTKGAAKSSAMAQGYEVEDQTVDAGLSGDLR